MRRLIPVARLAASIGAVLLVTLVYFLYIAVNPTTVAMTFLIAILLIATSWGIVEASAASVTAVLCFNFFFLPPYLQWTIADPQNWVAFLAFILTAIVASQLSGRARQREMDAGARQRDLERLYALSRALLLLEAGALAPGNIARHIADTFELGLVGLYDQRTDRVSWAGARDVPVVDLKLRDVARRGMSLRDPAGVVIVAIRLGGAPIGSLALTDSGLSDTVLNSIANLAAIGLERARADEATASAEIARESSELRATVLDALAHEFKTPLTSMKAASSDLLASTAREGRDHELAAIIDEELDRLGALVTDAVQMLRIDAGQFTVHPERQVVAGVIASTIAQFDRRLDGHPVIERVPGNITVDADRELLGLALRQLLDNAVKYSPPTSTIEIVASDNEGVEIAIHNSGSVIPEPEQPRVFERFYRGAHARDVPGTGMGLAIVRAIARAHNGTLRVSSSVEQGTTFTLWLPDAESKA